MPVQSLEYKSPHVEGDRKEILETAGRVGGENKGAEEVMSTHKVRLPLDPETGETSLCRSLA